MVETEYSATHRKSSNLEQVSEIFPETLQKLIDFKYQRKAARLAEAVGIPGATVSAWLKGKYLPSPEKLKQVSDATGARIEWLMTGQGPAFASGASTLDGPGSEHRTDTRAEAPPGAALPDALAVILRLERVIQDKDALIREMATRLTQSGRPGTGESLTAGRAGPLVRRIAAVVAALPPAEADQLLGLLEGVVESVEAGHAPGARREGDAS